MMIYLKLEQEVEKFLSSALKKEQRDPDLEKIISKFPSYSVVYAKKVINGRFPLAEEIIATSPYYVCAYLSELELKSIPENIHRIMLSNAMKEETLDVDKNYWIKEYFKFCDYLENKGTKPWWLSKTGLNWNYGKDSLNWNLK